MFECPETDVIGVHITKESITGTQAPIYIRDGGPMEVEDEEASG